MSNRDVWFLDSGGRSGYVSEMMQRISASLSSMIRCAGPTAECGRNDCQFGLDQFCQRLQIVLYNPGELCYSVEEMVGNAAHLPKQIRSHGPHLVQTFDGGAERANENECTEKATESDEVDIGVFHVIK